MFLILALAAAAAALPLTTDEQADLRCIGVVATAGSALPAKANADGREFAVIVGGDLMDRTGRTREQVAELMLAEGKATVARRPQPAEAADCVFRIDARLQAEAASAPLPEPVR